MRFRIVTLFLIAVVLTVCMALTSKPIESPRLVVVISVDQMCDGFFERFGEHFEGGLKRLWDEGAVFSNAHHAHAPSVTASGHAALSTGCYPNKNGINNNGLYNRLTGEDVYCVEDEDARIIGVENDGSLPGRSPKRMRTTTIGDWLKIKSPDSKVFSVARKDRSAVLMGGKNANRAFWFDNVSTRMVSSDYYEGDYPAWAASILGKNEMAELLKSGWVKKLPEEAYSKLRKDDFDVESGAFAADFPHTRDRMRPGYPEASKDLILMMCSPMADGFTLDFAKTLIENEKMGQGPQTDMLMIGCSAADAVGHHFGPESHEVMDYYLYLDAYLGELFNSLDQKIGRDRYWVVLSSDHGVAPMPEALQERGEDAKRVLRSEFVALADSIEALVKEQFGLTETLFEELSGGVYLDYDEADSKRLNRAELRNIIAAHFRNLDFIADAFTSDELESGVDRPFIQYYRNSYIPVLSPDILIRETRNTLIHGPLGTSHGSPYAYDTQVPIVFWGSAFRAAKYDRWVETVDMAPTLAGLLGCHPDIEVDGKIMSELFPEGMN